MASTHSFTIPVMVEYKKDCQKLKFRLNKTVQETLTAILRTLSVNADPAKWGLFRVARQAWLSPYKIISDLDIEMLETLILAPRQNILARRLERLGIPHEEMGMGETRVLKIETMAGTHKTVRYEFETTADQVIANIMKKDPVPDWQNYQLRYPALESKTSGAIYLAGTEQIALYRIPDLSELKLLKMRVRFNCRIQGPDGSLLGEMNVILPLGSSVSDGIEYLYLQVDPKAKISSEKEKIAVAQKWGMYLSTPENEHGFSMLPNRSIESYKIKPVDWIVFKRRPKDKADLLLQSHNKLRQAAATHSFVKVVCEPTKGQATFKFAATVTVQQATSKCSRKFDLYGAYGLWLPKSSQNKKALWLDPDQLFSSYNIENMSVVYFKDRPGAKPTAPTDDLGDADTTMKPSQDKMVGAKGVLTAAIKAEDDHKAAAAAAPASSAPINQSRFSTPLSFSTQLSGADKKPGKSDLDILDEILGDADLGVDIATVMASGSEAGAVSAAAGGALPCPQCGHMDFVEGKPCAECGFNSADKEELSQMEVTPPSEVDTSALADEPVIELDAAPIEAGEEAWADIDELLDFDI